SGRPPRTSRCDRAGRVVTIDPGALQGSGPGRDRPGRHGRRRGSRALCRGGGRGGAAAERARAAALGLRVPRCRDEPDRAGRGGGRLPRWGGPGLRGRQRSDRGGSPRSTDLPRHAGAGPCGRAGARARGPVSDLDHEELDEEPVAGISPTPQQHFAWRFRGAKDVLAPVITTLFAFFMGGLVVALTGKSPVRVSHAIFTGTGIGWFFQVGNYSARVPFGTSHMWFPWDTSSVAASN